jgi:carbonic anhydrase
VFGVAAMAADTHEHGKPKSAPDHAAHATNSVKGAAPASADAHGGHGSSAVQGPTAAQALSALMEGNQRFINDLMNKAHKNSDRRIEIAKGQQPFAIIVCCSDSRVPPEQVFDVGLGDIFVVRVAGNVIDDVGLGSIEYAAAHLHVPLVVVMGHERCGAVTAAISGDPAPAHVLAIVDKIQQNLAGTKPAAGDALDQAICINASAVAAQISNSAPILKDMVNAGTLKVVSMRYDLDDGSVKILP